MVTRGAFVDVLVCLCGPKISLLEDLEVNELRQKTLSILTASDLLTSDTSLATLVPGGTQCLLSLARVALSASVEIPDLWGVPQLTTRLLRRLLRCPQYEVRELTAEALLKRLETDQEAKTRPQWLDATVLSSLTSLALHETHLQCLAKVLQVLFVLCSGDELLWTDGAKTLSREEVLLHLLSLAQNSSHSVELHCAAVALVSQLTVRAISSDPKSSSTVSYSPQWGELVCSCCSEEQPLEAKLTAAKVLVNCADSLMTAPHLPLGLPTTLSLWRSLFMLLQDEDQEVRDAASDFMANVPAALLRKGSARVSVCPPVALDSGVGLLCGLLRLWGRVPEGVLALTGWLLGEEEGDDGTDADEASSVDEEEFLFEKGDLNLWAEPTQWVKLLHRNLDSLVSAAQQSQAPLTFEPDHVRRVSGLSDQARARLDASQRALASLPALPQFSCTMEHARLTLRQQRAVLTLDVLEKLR